MLYLIMRGLEGIADLIVSIFRGFVDLLEEDRAMFFLVIAVISFLIDSVLHLIGYFGTR